jgi:hypothetical protein
LAVPPWEGVYIYYTTKIYIVVYNAFMDAILTFRPAHASEFSAWCADTPVSLSDWRLWVSGSSRAKTYGKALVMCLAYVISGGSALY